MRCHLTLRGSGRTRASDAEFKVICRRCTSPLYGTREIVWTLPASSFDASQEACPSSESNDRMKEVLATLHDESVVVESVFLLSRGDGDYLVYYMCARSMEQARTVVKTSTHEVDAIHQRFQREA